MDRSKLIVLLSFLLHVNIIGFNTIFLHIVNHPISISIAVCQTLAYLLYPLVGWLSDVYFTRYRFVLCSFILVTVGNILLGIAGIIDFITGNKSNENFILFVGGLYTIVGLVGLGIFESTAIQFGMDQMVEDNSDKLSSFIHWYCWAFYFGRLVCITVYMGVLVILSKCVSNLDFLKFPHLKYVAVGALLTLLAIIQSCAIVGLCFLLISKKHLNTDPIGYNPLKLMYQVLKYSWKHKVPEKRSAFTYWENDIPPRIDLGKHKYGGPFTTEDVEDTKTFLRILLLLLSLLGFQLSGYGYSVLDQLLRQSCPPFWLLMIVGEPMLVALLVVSIGVPLYQWIIVHYFKRYIPNMLKRIGLGLLCCLAKQVFEITLQVTAEVTECYSKKNLYFTACYVSLSEMKVNGTCIVGSGLNYTNCSVSTGLFPWLVVSSTLQGMSFLLVFLTVLEFICAQAPLRLKGLLVGLWYASLAVNNMLRIPDIYTTAITSWRIFNGVKAGLMLLTLLAYICVSKWYRYRERDEIVNEQLLVEEIYEKELNQVYEEEMRKKRRRVQRASEKRRLLLKEV